MLGFSIYVVIGVITSLYLMRVEAIVSRHDLPNDKRFRDGKLRITTLWPLITLANAFFWPILLLIAIVVHTIITIITRRKAGHIDLMTRIVSRLTGTEPPLTK